MSVVHLAMPACAALALALSGCSGPSTEQSAADSRERAEVQKDMEVMRNASDGSAAKAVGDMMSDPAIQQQLGMGAAPAPSSAPPPAATPQAGSPAQGMDGQMATAMNSDTGQAQALAMCRALRGARDGAPRQAGPADIAQAQADLAADPNALGTCQAGM